MPGLNRLSLLVLLTVASLLTGCISFSNSEAARFAYTSQTTLEALQRENVTAISRLASEGGIVFVNRWVDWDASQRPGGPFPYPADSDSGAPLPLQGMEGLHWQEASIRITRDEFEGGEFRKLVKRIAALVKTTNEDFPGVRRDLNLIDHWRERSLGAAVEGKVVSNEFWYLSFVHEQGEWKLFRVEVAVH